MYDTGIVIRGIGIIEVTRLYRQAIAAKPRNQLEVAIRLAHLEMTETFLNQERSNFTAMLFRLIAKSDSGNLRRLSMGFPIETAIYASYISGISVKLPDEFVQQYRGARVDGTL